MAWPLFTLEALLLGFGLYAVADGAVALYAGLERRDDAYPFWPFAIEGALGLVFGGAIIAFPDMMAFVLWYLIAGWALATGVFELVGGLAGAPSLRGRDDAGERRCRQRACSAR